VTDFEFTEDRCRTPGDAKEESAQNDAGAYPSPAQEEHQCKYGVEPKLVWKAPERLVDRWSHSIREYAGYDVRHATQKHQKIFSDIFGVRPEMGIVAVPEKGHCRSRNEHEGKIWKYSEEPGRDETGPTRRFLQRPADQETAETKEDFDGELAKVLAVARNRRLRTSRQVKMMAE
jgi:hypothetical protein